MYVTTLWMDMSAQRLGTVGVWIQHSYIPLEKKKLKLKLQKFSYLIEIVGFFFSKSKTFSKKNFLPKNFILMGKLL